MAEELLCSQEQTDVSNRLSLAFVGRHSETQSHRELLPLHLDRQRPVLWLKLDPWNHDVVSCNKSCMKQQKNLI